MAICEWCGNKFRKAEAAEEFENEFWSLSYKKISPCLCGKCAIQAIYDEIEDTYFETCEECGCSFDLLDDRIKFRVKLSDDPGANLDLYSNGRTLCCECALDAYLNDPSNYSNYDEDEDEDEDDEDDDSEYISVEEAAEIWASNGKDEDYTFGYSEDELENALY